MTIVRPWRLITRQRSHIGLTDGRTFMCSLLESERDAAAGEIVGRELHLDSIPREDPDVVLPHLPGDLGEHVVPRVELHPKHGARERFDHLSFHLDLVFLDSQYARA